MIIFSGLFYFPETSSQSVKHLTHLGFDVFVKGHFTAAGFLTCYLDIGIFAGRATFVLFNYRCTLTWNTALYIFSKLLLRSKVVKVSGMDFRPEFSSIQVWREKTAMHQGKRTWYTAIIRSVGGFRRG